MTSKSKHKIGINKTHKMSCFQFIKNICPKNAVGGKNEIDILVLGLKGSGKTELCHTFCNIVRDDFTPTLGARVFSLEMNSTVVNFTEIGGNPALVDIWHFYFADCMGVIFLIDTHRSFENMNKNRKLIKTLLSKKFLNGKPFFIIGTFQDGPSILNVFEFSDAYDFEVYAEKDLTPIYVDVCDLNSYKDMRKGLQWMVNLIQQNYHAVANRINFDNKIKDEPVNPGEGGGSSKGGRPSTAPPIFHKKKRKIRDSQSSAIDKEQFKQSDNSDKVIDVL